MNPDEIWSILTMFCASLYPPGLLGHSTLGYELLLDDKESLSFSDAWREDLGVSGVLSKFSVDLAPATVMNQHIVTRRYG